MTFVILFFGWFCCRILAYQIGKEYAKGIGMDKTLSEKMQESVDFAKKYIAGMCAERNKMASVQNYSAAAELDAKIEGAEDVLHMFEDWL